MNEAHSLLVVVSDDAQVSVEVTGEQGHGLRQSGPGGGHQAENLPLTPYGTVQAKLKTVAADAVNEEERGAIFPVILNLDKTTIGECGKQILLSTEMAGTAEIKTGQRRTINFFLSHVQKTTGKSPRER